MEVISKDRRARARFGRCLSVSTGVGRSARLWDSYVSVTGNWKLWQDWIAVGRGPEDQKSETDTCNATARGERSNCRAHLG